jgi:hypothetical protein
MPSGIARPESTADSTLSAGCASKAAACGSETSLTTSFLLSMAEPFIVTKMASGLSATDATAQSSGWNERPANSV